jgi:DNA-3-methyladenine glycosylase II
MARKFLSSDLASRAPSRKSRVTVSADKTPLPKKKPARSKASPLPYPVVELIRCEATLDTALSILRGRDPVLIERLLEAAGPIPLRLRPPDLAGLAWIVVSQQVSVASANAIYARFAARFPDFPAAAITASSDDDLRSCGLSMPKIRTIRALAEAILTGVIDFAKLSGMDADEARRVLTSLHGIGPWTSDIFLLFCLGHPDAWPVGDLALQEAARLVLGLRKRPDAKQLERIGERWRPARGVAARVLWAWYGVRKKTGAPPRKGARLVK